MPDQSKACAVCLVVLPLDAFYRNPTAPGGRDRRCKTCVRAYMKRRYDGDEGVRRRAKESQRAANVANAARRDAVIARSCCADCGESDPVVLDFDHVRGEKVASIAAMIAGSYAWLTIEQEIAKCEVRCANCHRRRTAVQQGWRCATGDTGTRPADPAGRGPFDSDRRALPLEAFTWIG
jgi:hypothetical protein